MRLPTICRPALAAAALTAFATFAPKVEATAPPSPEPHLVIVGEPQRKAVFSAPRDNNPVASMVVNYIWTVKNTGTRESTATYLRGTCPVKSTDAPHPSAGAACDGTGYGATVPPLGVGVSAQIEGFMGVVLPCKDTTVKTQSACKVYLYAARITAKLDASPTSDSTEHVYEDNTYADKSYLEFRIDAPPYKPAQKTWVYVKNASPSPSKPSVSSVMLECSDRGAENANKAHPDWHLKSACVSLGLGYTYPIQASLTQGQEIGAFQLNAMPNEFSYHTADNVNVIMKTQLELVVRAWNVSGERMVLKTY